MKNQAIFLPMLMTMMLTAVVWFYMYAKRIPAMFRARKRPQAYQSPGSIEKYLPPETNFPANNLKNLLELPVLFYGLCFYLYVTGKADNLYVAAAWMFFALRVLHSVNHCTRNRVLLRFYSYAAGAVVLWFMLVRALVAALAVYF